MKVQINARRFTLTKALNRYIKRRLKFALGSQVEHVTRVDVTLSDINGPKGGEDKRCQMLLKIKGQGDVVIEDTQSHLYAAIDRAASRASQTTNKRITRLRNKAKRIKHAVQDFQQSKRDRYLAEDFEEHSISIGAI